MMKKIIKYLVCILLFLSFTIIVMGCEDWFTDEDNSGPCPQNRACYAKWVNSYHYRADGCSRSSCAVTSAGKDQITASCDCR
jgi:hypothetical protein